MNDPLQVTEAVLADVVKHCGAEAPGEACGFILAPRGTTVGTSVYPMDNVDPEPARGYVMDDQEVLSAYGEFDTAGLDPVAVYHSHTLTPPLMSDRDLERALDTSLAYLIVSLEKSRPRARAYRVRRPFIGVAEHTEVDIRIGHELGLSPAKPEGPWALTAGNEVAITYSRPRVTTTLTVVARVVAVGAGGVGLEPIATSPRNLPASLPLDRIRQVEVLKESPEAAALRRALWEHTRLIVSTLRDGSDVGLVPAMAAALAEAFPTTIRVVIREEPS